MSQTTFAGSHYPTTAAAARAWAETALPDVSVIESHEIGRVVASDLEAFCWTEASKIGEQLPDGPTEQEWRDECRTALRARIDAYRVQLTPADTAEIERKALAAANEDTAHGLTFAEWLAAAARSDSASDYDLRAAWRAGESPDDYAAAGAI